MTLWQWIRQQLIFHLVWHQIKRNSSMFLFLSYVGLLKFICKYIWIPDWYNSRRKMTYKHQILQMYQNKSSIYSIQNFDEMLRYILSYIKLLYYSVKTFISFEKYMNYSNIIREIIYACNRHYATLFAKHMISCNAIRFIVRFIVVLLFF